MSAENLISVGAMTLNQYGCYDPDRYEEEQMVGQTHILLQIGMIVVQGRSKDMNIGMAI
jgi:hypothetical protein